MPVGPPPMIVRITSLTVAPSMRSLIALTPAYLFMVDDAPLHRKLGFYEVFD